MDNLNERVAVALGGAQWACMDREGTIQCDLKGIILHYPSMEAAQEHCPVEGRVFQLPYIGAAFDTDRNALPQLWAEIERRGLDVEFSDALGAIQLDYMHSPGANGDRTFRWLLATATCEAHCRAFLAAVKG